MKLGPKNSPADVACQGTFCFHLPLAVDSTKEMEDSTRSKAGVRVSAIVIGTWLQPNSVTHLSTLIAAMTSNIQAQPTSWPKDGSSPLYHLRLGRRIAESQCCLLHHPNIPLFCRCSLNHSPPRSFHEPSRPTALKPAHFFSPLTRQGHRTLNKPRGQAFSHLDICPPAVHVFDFSKLGQLLHIVANACATSTANL